ncbi:MULTISPECIES: hypothetical protein [Yersinia]|nr:MULTISPECIES: hypothetical protein [Yersinia]
MNSPALSGLRPLEANFPSAAVAYQAVERRFLAGIRGDCQRLSAMINHF